MSSQSYVKRQLAVVTGAASLSGLLQQLAGRGYDLLLADSDLKMVQDAQAVRALGAKVESIPVDLSNYEGIEALYHAIQNHEFELSLAVLNVGVGLGCNAFGELDDELDWIDRNVRAIVQLTKRLLSDMVAQGHGQILFVSSAAPPVGGAAEACLLGSNAFIAKFAESLSTQLRGSGVSVRMIADATRVSEQARVLESNSDLG